MEMLPSTDLSGMATIKLYRSAVHVNLWVACTPGEGWVVFPPKLNGWKERRPATGVDPVYLREVSTVRALAAGLPVTEFWEAA